MGKPSPRRARPLPPPIFLHGSFSASIFASASTGPGNQASWPAILAFSFLGGKKAYNPLQQYLLPSSFLFLLALDKLAKAIANGKLVRPPLLHHPALAVKGAGNGDEAKGLDRDLVDAVGVQEVVGALCVD